MNDEIRNDRDNWSFYPFIRELYTMLSSFSIDLIADIRNFPGSSKFPRFNKEDLEISMPQNNIKYGHSKDHGGRRKAKPDINIKYSMLNNAKAWKLYLFQGL